MTEEINKYEDTIDSRDIQARIEWLESDDAKDTELYQSKEIEEFAEELENLQKLKKDYIDSFGDSSWGFGALFIADSYFIEYAQELASDIGAINDDATWPNTHIDWDSAASELQNDYTEFDFDGFEFYAREA